MQWRKLLLGFSFYYLMVVDVIVVLYMVFDGTSFFLTCDNCFTPDLTEQLLLVLVYTTIGLFIARYLKQKAPGINKIWVSLFYTIHFIVFVIPISLALTLLFNLLPKII